MSDQPKKKKWAIPGEVTGGQCTLVVEADTKEEARMKFLDSNWSAEDGSWECEPAVDMDDEEELWDSIEEY